MMENSAAYMFTQSTASDQLAIEYLQVEKNRSTDFANVWDAATELRKSSRLRQIQVPDGLREEHVLAILAYTRPGDFYSKFNDALRKYGTSDSVYAKKFHFKSFHYLLSVALDRLRKTRGSAPVTTYRGMTDRSKAQAGSQMKFGHFASSSLDIHIARSVGTNTLFNITSGKGVKITGYSLCQQDEVLIPPDEVFNVTQYSSDKIKGVAISLVAEGEAGIAVRVERGVGGQLQVVRSVGSALSAVALWCAGTVLAPIFL
ncbi:erythroblast NAD(P)(+)--arginine ADP-ribosyltransferase-like [Leucoraja erinacea]|uniref:erythroblast NAD(P)(+)--arginine ADP-ribosyltransferase-like n=1 Tax=Leucoraja erinaceus TaxID=7782 RepID=UPI002454B341|nr:erythroblast NAD(P)(+)--arginine ADP-ribosyltransferase-like [Leucoraja erinacea]